MKKIASLTLVFIFSLFFCNAQNHWAQRIWAPGFDIGFGVTNDNHGNVYSVGIFNGDGHFGTIVIPSINFEAYIAKYNSEGVVQWANHGGGPGVTEGHAVFTDAQDNVYITGYFDSVATFGSTTLTSTGMLDIFVAKLDSNGNFLWTINAGGTGVDNGKSISVDAAGNIFVTGSFSNQCDFGGISLTSYGENDMFLAKYNNSGTLLWVRSGGSNNDPVGYGIDYGTGVVTDLSGNAYISGSFNDTAYFDVDTLISYGTYDAFIAKYNSSGTLQWIQQGGGGSGDAANGIAIDMSGNLHITGSVYTDIPVQFNGIVLNGGGGDDLFHAVYNSSGGIISAFVDGGSKDQAGNAITLDPSGNVYITGSMLDSANFSGTVYAGKGFYDAFVVMYDATDNLIKARQYGAGNYDIGYGITTDVSGNCISTGYFHYNTQFGNTSLTGGSNGDVYLMTLNDSLEDASGLVVSNFHTGNSALLSNNISDIITDHNNLVYAATVDSGVYKFDGTIWQTINSPSNQVNSLFADSVNNIWICTADSGLLKYDGIGFTSFNTGNSGLTTNNISSVTSFPGRALWIGTKGNGCVKYNGITYTVFDTSNSALPDNVITSMNCDSSNVIWMGTESGGLVSFFNNVFTVYNTGNSGNPSDKINGAAIDEANNKVWVATDSGIASFDGSTWAVFNSSTGFTTDEFNDIYVSPSGTQNSASRKKGTVVSSGTVQRNANTGNSLFDNNVTSICVDTTGKVIWLGTQFNGVYRLVDTITTGISYALSNKNNFKVLQYPNPTSGEITLSYYLKNSSSVKIIISDINGKEEKLVNFDNQATGKYLQKISLSGYSAGIYFIKVITNEGMSVSRIINSGYQQ